MPEDIDIPAILGGPPIRPAGPPLWPLKDNEVEAALHAAWQDGSWGVYHGPHTTRLADWLRDYHQVDHLLLCGSGTYAIELALRALGAGVGDEVIETSYDYPGNFLSIHATGALPALVDIDPTGWEVNLERLHEAIGPATRGFLVSHLHGELVPMREVMAFARERGLWVIEDAAQCPGATVQGRKAGMWGDIGILSFGGSKLLTAGRGGALFTENEQIFQRARHVLQRGNNLICPLSEIQAIVLLPQVLKLDERNALRGQAVQSLTAALGDLPGIAGFSQRLDDSSPGFYKLGLRFDAQQFGLGRDRFLLAMRAEGIAMDEGFAPLQLGRSPRRFRHALRRDEFIRECQSIVILHHPVLLGGELAFAEVALAARRIWRHRERLAKWEPLP